MYSVKNHRKYAIVAAYDESFKRQYKSRFYYFLNKSDKYSDSSCSLTCDQASLSFLLGRYAWYNYLTICLLLVQNLDFSLIGQETKSQSVLRVIDRSDRNPPITATSVTL